MQIGIVGKRKNLNLPLCINKKISFRPAVFRFFLIEVLKTKLRLINAD